MLQGFEKGKEVIVFWYDLYYILMVLFFVFVFVFGYYYLFFFGLYL